MKTRLITIVRTIEIEVQGKDGKVEKKKVKKAFPCQINAGVPYDHRMCEYDD